MSRAQFLEDTSPPSKEEVYQTLLRSLKRRKGFGIVFIQASPAEANRLLPRIQHDLPQKQIETLTLVEPIENLYELIENLENKDVSKILFIQGLEISLEPYIKPGFGGEGDYYNIDTVPRILTHLNQRRDNFRDHFSNTCFVFILPAFAIKYFIHRAPDFFDWSAGIFKFPLDSDALSEELSDILLYRDKNNYSDFSSSEVNILLLKVQKLIDECDGNNIYLSDLYFEQGLLLQGAKRYQESIISYEKALQLKPGDPDFLNNLGLALADYGLFEQAVDSYDKALKSQPDYHFVWDNRGDALRSLGRFSEAIESYNQALRLKPDDQTAWDSLFKILLEADTAEFRSLLAFIQYSLSRYNLTSYYSPSDVISEAYIRGIRLISTGKVISNPLAWIKRISFNIIRELSRKQSKDNKAIERAAADLTVDKIEVDKTNKIDDNLESVKEALDLLSPLDQRIITLRAVEGLSWSEIAKRLGSEGLIDLQTDLKMAGRLRKRGSRAMQRLREMYHTVKPLDLSARENIDSGKGHE